MTRVWADTQRLVGKATTVTFDAAGDSVITAWADSSHTIKLGAVTVTSTG